jgi:1,4-alpha-glucan branching enzyme
LLKEASPKAGPATTEVSPDDVRQQSGQKTHASAFLSFTLHAHLPYVINYGTWPHGLEWLHEAAAETYLPLLRMLERLERDGIALHCNLDLSPILLEQLAHPVFVAEFPNYIHRKVVAAREDEAFFLQSGDHHLASTARFWQRFYTQALEGFQALNSDIISGFRHFNDAGLIRIITSAATHSYLPLLGTDESVRAQVRLAVESHARHLGVAPKGVWLPECGYRPAGYWDYPVKNPDGTQIGPGGVRKGVEDALAESSLSFFFVDSNLVQAPGEQPGGAPTEASVHRPHPVAPLDESGATNGSAAATVFARDPRTAVQVWSADIGYPGDFNYLDFHKKRFPGGHRYWKVTGADVGIADKHAYDAQAAADRVKVHASHFVGLVHETLHATAGHSVPPILCALFDAELFGHWWFEGILWLEAVARELHERPSDLALIDCERYLDLHPPTKAAPLAMREGSWGAGGSSQVWLNPQTSWTYERIYPAEIYTREIATEGRWIGSPLGTRIAQQLCRELLLLESSDWQFLITTGAARDYAEMRFWTHFGNFNEIRAIYTSWLADGAISAEQDKLLAVIELRDSIFADLDPGLWATID